MGNILAELTQKEHDDTGGIFKKRVLNYGFDGTNDQKVRTDSDGHLQVDVLSGGGGGTQYAEDAAHSTGATGTLALVVRQDSATQLAGTDGDYTALITDANGRLHTLDANSADIKTAVETIDDAVAAEGAALGSGVLVQGDDGTDRTNVLVDTSGHLQVDVLTVPSTAVTNAGTFAVQEDGAALTALQLIDDAVGAEGAALSKGVLIQGDDGTDRTNVLVDTAGHLQVDVVTAPSTAVTNAGTFAVQVDAALPAGTNAIGKLAANSGVDIGDVDVTSQIPGTGATNLGKARDAAAGATDTGVAMLGIRDDEKSAQGADGDYLLPTMDRFGALRVTQLPDATSEIKYAVIDDATSGDNTIVAAAGAGIKIRVLSVMMIAAGDVLARFESGAAGTALTGQMDLTTNSGFTLPYNPAGWFETADNTLLNLELDGAVSCDGCLTYVEV